MAFAEAVGGEIVNADALQVYRGFDIGTAKPSPEERRRVPHHLVDVLDPGERYSAGEFARRARAALAEIAARGRTAILVGGSGLYLRALWSGIAPMPPVDALVRAALLERLERRRVGGAPCRARASRPADGGAARPRPTRSAFCAPSRWRSSTGETLTSWIARQPFGAEPVAMHKVGLTLPRGVLYDAIAARVQAMIDAGWLDEVRALLGERSRSRLARISGDRLPAVGRVPGWRRRRRRVAAEGGHADEAVRQASGDLVSARGGNRLVGRPQDPGVPDVHDGDA